MTRTLRIGTRGSRLARAQAEWLRKEIESHFPDLRASLVIIKTSGDRFVDRPLRDIGGKGLFVKEIEQALLDGEIDCAIHSMKDVPSELAGDLTIAAVPRREDARDVLVSESGSNLNALPHGARIGTSSTRRRAICCSLRPDVVVEDLRGNVDTRLRHLADGRFDAILLAAAGLRRLGLQPLGAHALEPGAFVPAIGQGALAIETRPDAIGARLATFDDPQTRMCVMAEREVLKALGGSCHTPIAAHATVDGATIRIAGLVASPDGRRVIRSQADGALAHAESLGRRLADDLQGAGAAEILVALGSP